MSEKRPGLNIKAVSERTGVPLHTLRAWERRYGVPHPKRVAGNRYRVYDESDIADVLWMKHQVELGVSPAQASELLRQRRGGILTQPISVELPLAEKRTALFEAFRNADTERAQRVLDEVFVLFQPEQVILQIIQPVMRKIGEHWMKNQIGVWQEHIASNLMRQRLLAVIQAQAPLPRTAPRLVAACAPEEQHELGLLMISLLARWAGWNVTFTGQRTPLAELKQFTRSYKLILISVSTVTGLSSLIPLWSRENELIVPVVFGGFLFEQLPRLREHIPGAYLGPDTGQAMRTLAISTPRPAQWSPARDGLEAARRLQAERLKLGAETIAQVMSSLGHGWRVVPDRHGLGDLLTMPTLFLIDTVACALAFDVPELMEAQAGWLLTALPSRSVPPPMIRRHIQAFARAVNKMLDKKTSRLLEPLLARILE